LTYDASEWTGTSRPAGEILMALLEELSTDGMAPRDRLPFWNELAARMVAPVRIAALGGQDFKASMQYRRLKNLEILAPCSSPAEIVGGEDHNAGVLNLQLQHVGRSTNVTAGRTSVLDEGDFMLFDPSMPMKTSFAEPTQVLVLRLPLAYTEARMPRLRQMAGVKMPGQTGPSALFSSFMRNAWAQLETGTCDWADTLDEVIWPLLDMAYSSERIVAADMSRRDERRRALFAAVTDNLCDPDLDSRLIARAMGVSPRYVQMLFAEMATTPSAFIQEQRLDLAAQRLERDGPKVAITDVAFDVGFNDLSSFCRAFRRRFDVSPRDYRAGMRRGRLNS
jgi:AraC family transcriptional activator of tynA and feaB